MKRVVCMLETFVRVFILYFSPFKLIQAAVLKSGGPYVLHVWFTRPFCKGLPSCFQSTSYASERYSLVSPVIFLVSICIVYGSSGMLSFFCDFRKCYVSRSYAGLCPAVLEWDSLVPYQALW